MAIINKPSDFFNTKLYNGSGSNQSITGVGFQPDWVWIKERNGTNEHNLFDSVRGTTKRLESSTTAAEQTSSTTLTAFGSDGFTVGNNGGTGQSGGNYVGWNWKAGTSFTNDASGTGIGTIDSSGSVNQDAGFSIVKWVANGSNATIKHGLSTAPSMIILKTTSVQKNWVVGHDAIGWGKNLWLNGTDAVNTGSTYWNNTAPTSSVFSVGTAGDTNDSGETIIAYCFAEKQSYSKFGFYIGNGNADGPFIYTGFKPSFIMGKRTDGTGPWWMLDNKRDGYNVTNRYLLANDSRTEGTDAEYNTDILSNGFKARYNNGNFNASGGSYIYMAFAENPFVAGNFNVATAR